MDEAISLLSPKLIDRLIGVIDLKDGQAVHAVAGNRNHYQPVSIAKGDPSHLARQYFDLGIRRVYLADLDAIQHSRPQVDLLSGLLNQCRVFDLTVLDVGWMGTRESFVDFLDLDHAKMHWVVPTETATSGVCLSEACEVIDPGRIVLSLDYRQGKLVSRRDDESAWLDAASRCGIGGVIVLDLADVGTASGGSTVPICKRVSDVLTNAQLYSGGGIRSAINAQSLIDAGCDYCLVATSIHRLMNK